MRIELEKVSCPSCGGPLKVDEASGLVVCEYCGNHIALQNEDEEEKKELYDNCCIRFNCARSEADLRNLLPCLKELGNYKEAQELYDKSLIKIEVFRKQRIKKRILKTLIPLAIIMSIILTVVIAKQINKGKHDIEDISINIVDKYTYFDSYGHYCIHFDYKIENGTGTNINYLKVVTYIYKEENKSVGTITTTFGGYGTSSLNLEKNESIIEGTYLSENNLTNASSLFKELYYNKLSEYKIVYKIVNVEFGDGETISVS